ncbi:hypothetical protein D9M72_612680 [compost metagenome]
MARRVALLQEQVGTSIDEQGHAAVVRHFADGADACRLLFDRMHTRFADHLVLEIDADGADVDQTRDIGGPRCRIFGIGALEIDGDRQFRRADDQPGDIGKQR